MGYNKLNHVLYNTRSVQVYTFRDMKVLESFFDEIFYKGNKKVKFSSDKLMTSYIKEIVNLKTEYRFLFSLVDEEDYLRTELDITSCGNYIDFYHKGELVVRIDSYSEICYFSELCYLGVIKLRENTMLSQEEIDKLLQGDFGLDDLEDEE